MVASPYRGARTRAEIKPVEPDPGHAGEGRSVLAALDEEVAGSGGAGLARREPGRRLFRVGVKEGAGEGPVVPSAPADPGHAGEGRIFRCSSRTQGRRRVGA